jgi:hypothetical protein
MPYMEQKRHIISQSQILFITFRTLSSIYFINIYRIMEIGNKYNKNDAKRYSNALTLTESSLNSQNGACEPISHVDPKFKMTESLGF